MKTKAPDDLVRRVRNLDRKALDRFLADGQLLPKAHMAEIVGTHAVNDFILAHINGFHGSTKAEFSEWLGSVSEHDLSTWLVTRLKAGDSEAWNHWLAKNRDRLRKWTEIRVGISPGHGGDPSDVVQMACADLHRKIPSSITTYDQFLTWVRTTLRRRAIDLSRKKVLQNIADQSSGDSSDRARNLLGRIFATDSTPSKGADRAEREDCILKCSGDVSIEELLIVLLKHVDGCYLKPIAQGLGHSPVETAIMYHHALEYLRKTVDHLDIGNWPEDQDTPRESVQRELLKLPREQRAAVELKHFEDYTLSEIAQVLGYVEDASLLENEEYKKKKEGAVGSLLYRGMKPLKPVLERLIRSVQRN